MQKISRQDSAGPLCLPNGRTYDLRPSLGWSDVELTPRQTVPPSIPHDGRANIGRVI
jgi:hypothetical protein